MRSRGAIPFVVMVVVVMVVVVPLVLVVGAARRSVPWAAAEVVRLGGFQATVAGHRGWFGSYDMAGLGTAWCVDHGIAAPDADFGYSPTTLAEASPPVRTAIAWAIGRHGAGLGPGTRPDRVTAAALTLVLHDLMGAAYPTGRLDVGRLGAGQLDGFEGDEQAVLARARAVKADALAHAHHRGPLTLSATVDTTRGPPRPGRPGVLVARLTDAAGVGVAGWSSAPLPPVRCSRRTGTRQPMATASSASASWPHPERTASTSPAWPPTSSSRPSHPQPGGPSGWPGPAGFP